jgi:hypothetical protein
VELLGIAETQKAGDGKKIETLRRALRQLQNRQDAGREGRWTEGQAPRSA